MSDDLVARLRHAWDERERQLDEDERVALAAPAGPWHTSGPDTIAEWTIYDADWSVATATTYDHDDALGQSRGPGYIDANATAAHIARHDPARVLAEVERGRRDIAAKRRILDEHEQLANGVCDRCNEYGMYGDEQQAWPCTTVRLLAEAEGLA